MEFGRVSTPELETIDFTLPPDPAITKKVLVKKAPDKDFQAWVGCAKWGRKEWVGQIYPPKTKDAQFLDEYVKQFNCIELNAVFYMMPKKEQVAAWRKKAEAEGRPFKFCPKITQNISHRARLKNAEELTTAYLESITEFGDCLGPVFLQLSDNFGPKNIDTLREYLAAFPKDVPLFTELRHKEWYADEKVREEVFSMFHELNIGSIITDAAGRRDCVHMHLSTPDAFIRFVGNSLHTSDYSRIDEWVARLKKWKSEGLKSFWFFMHQHDERYSPKLADYLIRELNDKLDLSIPELTFLDE
ncbi:MAG: DUF72 domain-containing protein [Mucilaginibacter polytrichastri]|nr:DUF72 domain-containing protein [Mucilaginibacter polytrichastri]